ncbi:hypothetical protein V8G54_031439 [Vigna mungo]|uniref:Uncharacterized protein n=1 Tax=Vigna mungo TaxID=3915 RepID=A0AAQ3RFS9_VIGMU
MNNLTKNTQGTWREDGNRKRHLGEGVGESGTSDAGTNDDDIGGADETERWIWRGIAADSGCCAEKRRCDRKIVREEERNVMMRFVVTEFEEGRLRHGCVSERV